MVGEGDSMRRFTPGPWWVAPPLFDGDVIFALPQEKGRRNEVVAVGILHHADACLIAAAPIMYSILAEHRDTPEVKKLIEWIDREGASQ